MKHEITCSKEVWGDTGFYHYPCSKKAVVKRDDKLYCKIHDPEYIKAKEKKHEEKYNSERCKKCKYHFPNTYYKYCPECGTKKILTLNL